jgi:hypothetical protein
MPSQEPLGPFCQSCSMPLGKPEDFGTDLSGHRVNDYCRHCYQDGAFTDPEVTMEEMLNRCVAIMAKQGIMPETKARALLTEVMPRLRRWRREAGVLHAVGGRGLTAGDEEC